MSADNTTPPPIGATTPPSSSSATPGTRNESVPALIKELASDLSALLGKEVELAKSELREAAEETKAGVMAMGAGAIVTIAAVVVLLMGGVYALANMVPLWMSALIVGGIALIIGIILLKSGQKKVEPGNFVPERTADALTKDKRTVKRNVT